MSKQRNPATFEWSDDEWAVLEPLEPMQRMALVVAAMMQGRTLLGQAEHDGLILRGGGKADTPGS